MLACRVCGGELYPRPLLEYRNMPGQAQFMPGPDDLATEKGADLDVCQCSACGLVQLAGAPVHYYREVVRAAAFSPEMRGFRLEQFRAFAAQHGLAGRKVLEVGSGRGEYLAVLEEAGMDAHGLEHSAESVRTCKREGRKATRGFIHGPAKKVPGAPYAGFFILNFLEHLPKPVASLRGIAANLEPGAIGMVEVPNFDMIVRQGLFSEFIADHLTYFTLETLSQTLAIAGFEVLEARSVWHDYILSATVRKRVPADLGHLNDYQARITRDVAAFVDKYDRVAIWGAGHQALAVISLLSLQDRVCFVLDSAPFKQGKYTPASHLPIVPPATLKTDPVDAVLVMAASYSDEVARILRRDYAPNLAVAILRDHGLEIV